MKQAEPRLTSLEQAEPRLTSLEQAEPQVTFDEKSHTYSVDGVSMKRSVTQLVSSFFPEFDSEQVARRMLQRDDFLTAPQYLQYRAILYDHPPTSVEALKLIVSSWKKNNEEDSSLGTKMHQSIEDYYTLKHLPSPMTREFKMFLQFDLYTRRQGYLPFRSEPIVFDAHLSLAGSVDMLYVHRRDVATHPTRVWMVDWKRSKEIKKSAFGRETGFAPFESLANCNYQHYSVQLNLYKFLLEKNHGMLVEKMTLVILHPNQDKYIDLDVADLQHLIEPALESA